MALFTFRVNVPNVHVITLLNESWGYSSGNLYQNMVFMKGRILCGSGGIAFILVFDHFQKLVERILKQITPSKLQ